MRDRDIHLDVSSLKKCIYLDVSPLKKMFQCHSLVEKLFKSEAGVSMVWLNQISSERTWGVPLLTAGASVIRSFRSSIFKVQSKDQIA